MERILVGIDARTPFWEALDRALCLGARIQARVDVLAVFVREGEATSGAGLETLKRVEAQVAAAAQAGANVALFMAEGRYEQELVAAARQLRTTLLVAAAAGVDERGGEREAENLGEILAGVDCRVELVSPRRDADRKKDVT